MEVLSAPQLPARMPSPTLTNPDMILPDFPSQPSNSPRAPADSPSTLSQWSDGRVNDESQMKFRNILSNGRRLKHKNSEKQLKEVDVKPQDRHSDLSQKNGNSAIASSPLLHDEFSNKGTGNTLTPDISKENWDGFDDVSVISEGVSPLVDSERGSYLAMENGGLDGYKFSERFRTAIAEEDEDPYSHAAMSVRAEQILANAKKRLTEMESNLNRARHTINRPSSSMSSFANHSPDRQSLYTIPKNLSPSKHRQQYSTTPNTKGHSRVFSETSVPSSMQTSTVNGNRYTEGARSSSAMGVAGTDSSMDESSRQGPEASRDWFWSGLTRSTSHGTRHNYGLQPLNEDGPPPSTFDSPERQHSPPLVADKPAALPSESRASNVTSVDSTNPPAAGLTRARSTNQMRDIRDQMQDLKGKISNLKQRAREDSLRRRSLQSLRTPSPFTAAEQWYGGSPVYQRDRSRSRSRPRDNSPPTIQEAVEEDDKEMQYPAREITPSQNEKIQRDSQGSVQAVNLNYPTEGPPREMGDSPNTVIDISTPELSRPQSKERESVLQDLDEDGEQNSLHDRDQDFHESSSSPVGERHEDRPDAFDYEHFFLHSGMGTIGHGRKSRSSSHSSSSSVETTKPNNAVVEVPSDLGSGEGANIGENPGSNESNSQQNGHSRKGSVESVSTVATFATATEGKSSDEGSEEDEWVYSRPMAGSWEPEVPPNRKFTVGRKDGPQRHTRTAPNATSDQGSLAPKGSDAEGDRDSTDTVKGIDSRQRSAMPDLLAILTKRLPLDEKETRDRPIELNESDKELAERLVKSLAKVCWQLQVASHRGGKYEGRPWRRRLDAARRVLDGDVNGEAF